MGGIYAMHGRDKECIQSLVGNGNGREH